MTGPVVKGWCPGAYRPMASGDGLILRVRPMLAEISRVQALGLAHVAETFGSGVIDLTNRANLQLRGVSEADYEPALAALSDLGLLDATPEIEKRRNVLVTPFWETDDLTHRIAQAVIGSLTLFPQLPAKVGFAIDLGAKRHLASDPADFRFERSAEGGLILRADGAALGRPVSEETAIEAAVEMAAWFAARKTPDLRRMTRVVSTYDLPTAWRVATPVASAAAPLPGRALLGVPFGQMQSIALRELLEGNAVTALRVTPWRMIGLIGEAAAQTDGFLTKGDDPLLSVDACPGAPFCPAASVETRNLARALAERPLRDFHVSGCAKGCARARPAAQVLVGRDGHFDLVENGCAWDAPIRTGLSPEDLLTGAL